MDYISLLRCQVVCKAWNELHSSDSYQKKREELLMLEMRCDECERPYGYPHPCGYRCDQCGKVYRYVNFFRFISEDALQHNICKETSSCTSNAKENSPNKEDCSTVQTSVTPFEKEKPMTSYSFSVSPSAAIGNFKNVRRELK